MGRDYARFRADIWADDHWRTLSPGAQWLYMHLLTSPTLSHAGVADWRPVRIAKLARSLTPDGVRKYADELERERFILTDDSTEEVVIRSFLRHDGLLQNPNLWKSIGMAFADTYSAPLKAMIAVEASRLQSESPDGFTSKGGRVTNPWESPYLQTLLKSGSDTPPERGSDTPSDTPSPEGLDRGSSPTPAPAPTPKASPSEARKRETPLPKDWAPTADHIKRAKTLGIDVIDAAENFRLHAETHDRRAASWNGAFTTWLKKTKPSNVTHIKRDIPKNDEWMYR